MEKPYRLNSSVVARKNGKFLLVKKARLRHAWQFPQGGVEAGESFEEAARREFEEELGCGGDQIRLVGKAAVYRYDWPAGEKLSAYLEKFRGQEVHLFLADFLGNDDEIELDSKELAEWRWVAAEELPTLLDSPDYLATIQKIIDAKN